jgi:hypothetical protein
MCMDLDADVGIINILKHMFSMAPMGMLHDLNRIYLYLGKPLLLNDFTRTVNLTKRGYSVYLNLAFQRRILVPKPPS